MDEMEAQTTAVAGVDLGTGPRADLSVSCSWSTEQQHQAPRRRAARAQTVHCTRASGCVPSPTVVPSQLMSTVQRPPCLRLASQPDLPVADSLPRRLVVPPQQLGLEHGRGHCWYRTGHLQRLARVGEARGMYRAERTSGEGCAEKTRGRHAARTDN